ncbi:hypothetical protein HII36_45445 [Nonomuraea sp. NN258]|uniref:hypothetical protein n=1 Tax=Nonomuraea antri TaxID=2730852 RepID=UPI001569A113|nr:hypothetical protein [Nonomuraea antri]NRQ39019.1 hypothetical protein [Nonomuraea antri]
MNQTRKMWASAAVVGAIVVGGVSVAAAASAGRLENAGQQTKVTVRNTTPATAPQSGPPATQSSAAPETTDGIVVSTEVNPDPGEVVEFWTGERMEGAQPMPMPEVKEGEFEVAD